MGDHNVTRERRVAKGLCGDCGKRPARPKRLFCAPCSKKRNAYGKTAMRKKIVRGAHSGVRTRDHERCTLCRKSGHDRRTCDMFGTKSRKPEQEVMQPWKRPSRSPDRPDDGGDEGDEVELAAFRWDPDGS